MQAYYDLYIHAQGRPAPIVHPNLMDSEAVSIMWDHAEDHHTKPGQAVQWTDTERHFHSIDDRFNYQLIRR